MRHITKYIIAFCAMFSGYTYSTDFLKPGLWVNSNKAGHVCVAQNNSVPSLAYLRLEVEMSGTGSEQSTECNIGHFVFENRTGYEAGFSCVVRTAKIPAPKTGRKYVESKHFLVYVRAKKINKNRFYGAIGQKNGTVYPAIGEKNINRLDKYNFYTWTRKKCAAPINTFYQFSTYYGFPVSLMQDRVTRECQGGVASRFCCKYDTVNFPNHGRKSPNLCGD